jgi:hypothetical protein
MGIEVTLPGNKNGGANLADIRAGKTTINTYREKNRKKQKGVKY